MKIDNRKDKIVVTSSAGQVVIYKETASGFSKSDFHDKFGSRLGDATEEVRNLLPKAQKGKKSKKSKDKEE